VLRPDELYANDRFQDDYSPPDSDGTVKSVSTGAVYHLTKWGSLFANYADTFVPPTTTVKIDGRLFPCQVSHGWDTGMRFHALGDKVVATFIYYEGKQDNAIASGSSIFRFNSILRARPGHADTGINNRGLRLLPSSWNDSQQTKTRGFEIDITANLTRNWRLMFNMAAPRTYTTSRNTESLAYYRANEETLRLIMEDAGAGFNGNTAYLAEDPISANATMLSTAITDWNILQNTLLNLPEGRQKTLRVPNIILNAFTDYTFSKGPLKGLRVGAGINYRGRQVIGYRGGDTIVAPDDPTRAIDDPAAGANDTVGIPGYGLATLTLGYTWRVSNKVRVVFDLKVDNLFDYDKPVYTNTMPRPVNGDVTSPARVATPYDYGWIMPRNITFSASVRF
jgi:outer membrane receptor for ferric coprogen and ferric-rhodotorulic acid